MLEDLEVFLNESGSGPGRVMIERTCNMSVEHCNLQCFMRHMRPKHPKPQQNAVVSQCFSYLYRTSQRPQRKNLSHYEH